MKINKNTLSHGFPNNVRRKCNGTDFLVVDNSFANKSQPFTFEGNITDGILIQGKEGLRIFIKSIVILGTGSQGTVYVKQGSDSKVILPAYFSQFSRASTSGAFNFPLEYGESLKVSIEGRGEQETFIGISFIEGVE